MFIEKKVKKGKFIKKDIEKFNCFIENVEKCVEEKVVFEVEEEVKWEVECEVEE